MHPTFQSLETPFKQAKYYPVSPVVQLDSELAANQPVSIHDDGNADQMAKDYKGILEAEIKQAEEEVKER